MLGWKRGSASSTEDKWVCCSITDGKRQGDRLSFSRIANRWQPYPPSRWRVDVHIVCLLILVERMYRWAIGTEIFYWSFQPASWSLSPWLSWFHVWINRKQLRFVTSAACFSRRCAPLNPQRTMLSHSRSWGWTIHTEGRKTIPPLAVKCCPVLSFLCAKSQVQHESQAGPRGWGGGVIDFCLPPLPSVGSSPWKLEQQSIEIW